MLKKIAFMAGLWLALTAANLAHAGTVLSIVSYTADSGTGISTSLAYTHKLDFGNDASPATINGVLFDAATGNTSGSAGGFGWSSSGVNGSIDESTGNGSIVGIGAGEGIRKLLADFVYNTAASGTETITLTNLNPGQQYELRMYYREWSGSPERFNDITFNEGSGNTTTNINQDAANGAAGGQYLPYRYTAGAGGQLTITIVTTNTPAASWHNYGLTNHAVPEPATYWLLAVGAIGMVGAIRARRVKQAA